MKINAEKRFFIFLLVIVMMLSVLPTSVFAVEMLNTTVLDGKIAITSDGVSGQGSGNNSGGTITVTTKATASCSFGKYSYTANSHTITIKNNTADETLMLEFDYAASGLGTLTIDGVTKTSMPSGSYSKSLAPGASITIVITSPARGTDNSGAEASIVLSNFEALDTSTKKITVVAAEGGTIKANGSVVSTATSIEADYATGVQLAATPASGYVFVGWGDSNENVLSTTATFHLQTTNDIIVSALFVPDDEQGYWLAGGKVHTDLNAACTAAQNGDKKVTLLKNATLPEGTYTIPSDVSVLIPFDEAFTSYGPDPELAANGAKWTVPTPYRTLKLANGAKLEINGTLELAAKHHVSSGSTSINYGGAIYGKYGHIAMEDGAIINVNNGATLYAWGIISGAGEVNANSGSTVYEKMQINDYRGGTVTSSLVTLYSNRKLFPFGQYYVQNIEVEERIEAGATLMVHAGVYLSASETATVSFVGKEGSGSMFELKDGTTAVKKYNAETDRLEINVYGNATLGSISLSFEGQSVNSANFRLGINNNIDIIVHTGVVTISQAMVLQSGATVTVGRDATVYNTTELFIMDDEDWGTYAKGVLLMPVKYTYANGTTVKRTSVTDAILDINGNFINNGQLYTSGSQSVISSEKTGVYALLSPAKSGETLNQLDHNSFSYGMTSDWVEISCTAADLVHGDGTALRAEGAQYDAYIYDSFLDKWVQKNIYNEGAGYTATLYYNPNCNGNDVTTHLVDYFDNALSFMGSGNTAMAPYSFALAENSFTRPNGYKFLGWSTDPNATTAEWHPGDYVTISADTIIYAVWEKPKFSISWDVEGTVSTTPDVVAGTVPQYSGDEPVKNSDDNYHYIFAGWATDKNGPVLPTLPEVTGNATYYAVFTPVKHSYSETSPHTCSCGKTASCTDSDADEDCVCDLGCGKIFHTEGEVVVENNKAPDCVNAGSYDKVVYCTECKEELSRETITVNATGHTEGEVVVENKVDPDCVNAGSYDNVVYCAVCGEELSRETITVNATGHTPGAAADCEHAQTCTVCGEVLNAALGHTEGEVVVENNVAPDCVNAGSYDNVVYCTVCGEELSRDTVTVDALGHTEGEVVVENNVDPDCENAGSYDNVVYCTVCNEELSRETITVDALGHDYEISGYVNNGDDHTVNYVCKSNASHKMSVNEPHDYNNAAYTCACGDVKTFTLSVNILVDGVTYELTVPYGANLLDVLTKAEADDIIPAIGNKYRYNNETFNGEKVVTGYSYFDEETGKWVVDIYDMTMPAKDFHIYQDAEDIGWQYLEAGTKYAGEESYLYGWNYIEEDYDNVVDGAWYYFDNEGYRAEGITRVPYPEKEINGITYTYNADDYAYWESHKDTSSYTDAETAMFVFDENGKFQHSETGIIDHNGTNRYAVNGMIPWHVGMVEIDGDYYYFKGDKNGGGNYMCTGNVYATRNTTSFEIVNGRIYTFGVDGKLCKYDGIVNIDGTLYYYDNCRLASGEGLIYIDGDYYYVHGTGKLAVNEKCYVEDVKDFNIVPDAYEFDENGKMVRPIDPDEYNGLIKIDRDWYYYINGVKQSGLGVVEFTDENGDIFYVYVRSNGQLATGKYWPTTRNDLLDRGEYDWGTDGKYYPTPEAEVLDGIVEIDGEYYYYINGVKQSGLGVVELTDENGATFYIYVRSNGKLATGKYWPTTRNDLLDRGEYDWGTDGKYYPAN